MIKSELVSRLAERNPHLYQRDVEHIVNSILDEIVDAANRVAGTIAEISSAATEQANGVEEMAKTVAHMDEITQRNSLMADAIAVHAKAAGISSMGFIGYNDAYGEGWLVEMRRSYFRRVTTPLVSASWQQTLRRSSMESVFGLAVSTRSR